MAKGPATKGAQISLQLACLLGHSGCWPSSKKNGKLCRQCRTPYITLRKEHGLSTKNCSTSWGKKKFNEGKRSLMRVRRVTSTASPGRAPFMIHDFGECQWSSQERVGARKPDSWYRDGKATSAMSPPQVVVLHSVKPSTSAKPACDVGPVLTSFLGLPPQFPVCAVDICVCWALSLSYY